MGGHANNDYYNDVWSSSDTGKTWERLPDAPWKARSYHTAKVFGDYVYLLAGHDSTTWFNDVWRTKNGSSWESVVGNASWSPRAATALQIRHDQMFLMGGSTGGLLPPIGHGKVLNDVWTSDNGADWTLVTPSAPWPAREGMQKLTALYGENDTIVLTSGEAGYFGPYYHDVWATTDGLNWSLLNREADFSKRSGNLLLNVDGSLFTFGGYGFPFMKHDAYCLPTGNASAPWKRLKDAPWHGRFDYDMVVVNSSIILMGGEASLFGAGGPYYNDVWAYHDVQCE